MTKNSPKGTNFKNFYLDGQTYYYIHRHLAHFEKDEAIALYQEQKRNGYINMKKRYIQNYLKNINTVNEKNLDILNVAMNEEELVGDLDKQILDVLNSSVSTAIQGFNLEKYLKTAYQSLDNFIDTKEAKELDKLFAQITAATEILTSSRGELVVLLGKNGIYQKHRDLNKLYNLLQKEINHLEGKTLTVNQSRLLSVERSLAQLIKGLKQKNINKSILQRYLSNIFSTQIGEYLVSKGIGQGLNVCLSEIRKSLTGTKNIDFKEDEEISNFLKQFGQSGRTTFKTDNSFKNINIALKDSGDTIDINLGLSTKWYKGGGNEGVAVTTETSKSGSFLRRIDQMFNDTSKYYIYNTLGLVSQDNTMYAALKSAMIARNLDVLISGTGLQGDFAQFIVINGYFYSIWDIINAVEKFNEGSGTFDEKSATDPITISAGGLSKVALLTQEAQKQRKNLTKAFVRSKQQNELIRQLTFVGHFYPNRLRNIVS